MHGLDGRQILLDDGVDAAPALFDVAADTAAQTHVGVGVDKDADVHFIAERLVHKDHDALDHDDLPRLDVQDLVRAVVDGIVIGGAVDRLTGFQLAQMPDHHVGVECVRAVVVEVGALLIAHFVVPLVVVIVAEHADIIAEAIHERLDKRRFSATGSAGDTNDDHI